MDQPVEPQRLLDRAHGGDAAAVCELFARYRDRLKKMIRVRMNARIRGRVDDSDILQEAYMEAARRLPEYVNDPRTPFFLWLRKITHQRIIDVHRHHFTYQRRDVNRDVPLHGHPTQATSDCIAAQLLGSLTSPSRAAIHKETRFALLASLDRMKETDREILLLRHFEHLTNQEAAAELEIDPSAASKRYLRALRRMYDILVDLGLGSEALSSS
jgi:RNA polymerase sigma-70 factor (ECF subfamily)